MNISRRLKIFIALNLIIYLATGLYLIFFLKEINEIPENFSYEADILSTDNFYDEEAGAYLGAQASKTHFSYNVSEIKDNVLIIRNVFDVRQLNGDKIFSVERFYGIDHETGKHVPGYGDKDRTGYLFAPRNLKKGENYTYWHINYDTPAEMVYQNEELINGLNTYHYIAEYDADQTSSLTNLPGVPEEKGIKTEITLETWIEPKTGNLIKYKDNTIAYYYDIQTGEKLSPWNNFSNEYSELSTRFQVEKTQNKKNSLVILEIALPGTLLAINFAFTIFIYLNRNSKGGEAEETTTKLAQKYTPSLAIFLVLTMVTIFSYRVAQNNLDDTKQLKFDQEVNKIETAIQRRTDLYINALTAGQGFYYASPDLDREKWKTFTDSLNLQENYPGIQGYGYAEMIEPEDLEKHISQIKSEGFPEYTVRPEGERDKYSSIIYLEPFDERNQKAFGYDMYSNEIRRTAMDLARDTGNAQLSGKVELVQENDTDIQAGFLIYLPVYENQSVALSSVTDRRESLQGYVYSPFRATNFMTGIIGNTDILVDFAIFDGDVEKLDDKDKIYDSNDNERNFDEKEIKSGDFASKRLLNIANHPWTIYYTPKQEFSATAVDEILPYAIVAFGTTFSLLISFIVFILSNARANAISIAEGMTKDLVEKNKENQTISAELEKANESLESKATELSKKLGELKETNQMMVGREMKMLELKEKLAKYENTENPAT